MTRAFIPTLIGIVVIASVGSLAYWQHAAQADPGMASQPQETRSPAETSYTFADIVAHNTASDCWAIINGNVYDLTSWLPRHPGGERAIEGLCGKDGSAAFNSQHGGNAAQEGILADFKIGVLAQ